MSYGKFLLGFLELYQCEIVLLITTSHIRVYVLIIFHVWKSFSGGIFEHIKNIVQFGILD